mmetsp:Transcript_21608/g.30033  ORF Transcript_21608/g.30033 Transcript_21608/m.30033 type:complete len:563 (+) Transcript_21608:171-1859(+)
MNSEGLFSGIPVGILTDSYKAGHFMMYPNSKKMVAYGEFRKGFMGKDGKHDEVDKRLIVYGVRYIVETFIHKQWTMKDVDDITLFYKQHKAPLATPYPFPEDLFRKFVAENDGYFPVRLEALPEGTVVTAHVPVYQITAEEPYSPLCTFLETLLTQIWYPSTVATLSRRCKDLISDAFNKTVDEENFFLLGSRLHDFGFRGCTCTEQSVLGGCAHLLNFDGTDTMSAAYYAQFFLNGGLPVGNSIPATEHSVMTSWETEKQAMENMATKFGDGLFAVVMDAYDYLEALEKVLPAGIEIKSKHESGYLVIRPDSGDPTEAIIDGLKALEKVCGVNVNKKGYKVIQGAGIIQGDGIGIHTIGKILDAVAAHGYSAQSVGFGMGGGLLQKVNRDTMSFATKLSYIHVQGQEKGRNIMKAPKTDPAKISLPGILQVERVKGVPTITCVPDNGHGTPLDPAKNMLKVVYDKRPLAHSPWDSFSVLRERVEEEWKAMEPNKGADPISDQLKAAIAEISPAHAKKLSEKVAAPKPSASSAAKLAEEAIINEEIAKLKSKIQELKMGLSS